VQRQKPVNISESPFFYDYLYIAPPLLKEKMKLYEGGVIT
jgi:hypothetical protein